MILEGTHPALTQVPPRILRSMCVTAAPRSAAVRAAAMAAPPVQMIATRKPPPVALQRVDPQVPQGSMDATIGVPLLALCSRAPTRSPKAEPDRAHRSRFRYPPARARSTRDISLRRSPCPVGLQRARWALSVRDAVRRGTELRLRPVLMTASVAILGLVPMLISSGVGAETKDRSRRSWSEASSPPHF